mgnify:CR=1 FL=1
MKASVYNLKNEVVGSIELSDAVFARAWNANLVHQALVAQEANARVTRANTKGRGEVAGGGRKPWRQKGTGRARHASIRSPLWKGGGKSHGPTKEKIYGKKINKKVRQAALRMALTSKARDKELFVVDSLSRYARSREERQFPSIKTKEISVMLGNFSNPAMTEMKDVKRPTFLVVCNTNDALFIRAARNISFVGTIAAKSLNARDVLKYKFVLLPKDAIKVISETFGKKHFSSRKISKEANKDTVK